MQKPEDGAVLVGGLFDPDQHGEKGGAQAGCEAHVRGSQAGMRQDGGNHGEQADCEDTGGGSEVTPRPPEDHQAAEHKERQIAEAHQGDGLFRVMLVGDQVPAFQLKIRFAARARARKVGQYCDHGARQRGMLRFVSIDVLSHILQAAGDVGGFVPRGGEDVIGGDDAAGAKQEEAGRQHAGMLREKRFDAGCPDAGWGGRGWCFGCLGRSGFPGIGGGLFSGQACAPVSERLVRA